MLLPSHTGPAKTRIPNMPEGGEGCVFDVFFLMFAFLLFLPLPVLVEMCVLIYIDEKLASR